MKDINEMTRAEFEALPILDEKSQIMAQGIVLLPTTGKHDSGYGYFYAIPYLQGTPIGKLPPYDVFNVIDIRYVNVDCLYRSKLMRIIFGGVKEVSASMHGAWGEIMDSEIWADKNGTQWKVAEMTTRLIKKQAKEVDRKLRKLLNQPVKNISHYDYGLATINFYFGALRRFEMELKRRKQNEKL